MNSGMWTWMDDSRMTNAEGWYGDNGVPDSANSPGSRFGSMSWTDADGHFWQFGGLGYAAWDPEPGSEEGYLNDLWKSLRTPDTFLLSSDADDPDPDGSFTLTWASSDGAINY